MIGRHHPLLLAAFAGALFGAGLLLSGMTVPVRVIGFLDPFTHWDPTLAFVMVGGVAFYALAFRLITRLTSESLFGDVFHIPTRKDIDLRLVLGAAIFGIGWGLGGFCPGPGLVSAAGGSTSALLFVGAMVAGMTLHRNTAGRS